MGLGSVITVITVVTVNTVVRAASRVAMWTTRATDCIRMYQ